MPDHSVLRWDKIVDLCQHRCYRSFKEKAKSISSLLQGRDPEEVARLVHEALHDATEELVKQARPASFLWRTIKIVLGNTSPVGRLFGAQDELNVRQSEAQGWVYFLMDLGELSAGRTPREQGPVDHSDGVATFLDLASGYQIPPQRDENWTDSKVVATL